MTQSTKPSLELAKGSKLDPRRLKEMYERLTGKTMTDAEFAQMTKDLKDADKPKR